MILLNKVTLAMVLFCFAAAPCILPAQGPPTGPPQATISTATFSVGTVALHPNNADLVLGCTTTYPPGVASATGAMKCFYKDVNGVFVLYKSFGFPAAATATFTIPPHNGLWSPLPSVYKFELVINGKKATLIMNNKAPAPASGGSGDVESYFVDSGTGGPG